MCKRFRLTIVILQRISITSSSAFTTSNVLLNGTDSENLLLQGFWTNMLSATIREKAIQLKMLRIICKI